MINQLRQQLRAVFLPGLGLKRWLGVAFIGLFQLAIGIGIWLSSYLKAAKGSGVSKYLTFRFLPRFPRGLIFVASGVATTLLGWRRLSRALLRLMVPERANAEFMEIVRERQRAAHGRRVVVVGGDPGLTPVLRALLLLKEDVRIDVILTATEGGRLAQSLRSKFGLSNEQIIYPTEAESVLYAELEDGTLLEGATMINRTHAGRIKDLFLSRDIRRVQVWESENNGLGNKVKLRGYMPNVAERALEVLADAELIIFAPGHIYTQVLPNLTQPRFAQAVRESQAIKVFVANLMTEPGRTDNWTVSDYLEAIREMTGVQMDYAIVHQGNVSKAMLDQYRNEGADLVHFSPDEEFSQLIFADTGEQTTLLDDAIILRDHLITEAPQIVTFQRDGDTILREMPVVRHDPEKLAPLFARLLEQEEE